VDGIGRGGGEEVRTICTHAPALSRWLRAARAASSIGFFMRRSQRRHLFFLYPRSCTPWVICAGDPSVEESSGVVGVAPRSGEWM
jgi:hypothetical protein